jgi:hypothetical protein
LHRCIPRNGAKFYQQGLNHHVGARISRLACPALVGLPHHKVVDGVQLADCRSCGILVAIVQ